MSVIVRADIRLESETKLWHNKCWGRRFGSCWSLEATGCMLDLVWKQSKFEHVWFVWSNFLPSLKFLFRIKSNHVERGWIRMLWKSLFLRSALLSLWNVNNTWPKWPLNKVFFGGHYVNIFMGVLLDCSTRNCFEIVGYVLVAMEAKTEPAQEWVGYAWESAAG